MSDSVSVMKLSAPAKVNISLRILGKRPDGYHALESLMTPISLHDEIEVSLIPGRHDFQISCTDPEIPCDSTNLAHVATCKFSEACGMPLGGAIHIQKQIPHGAGLGGGSSDAASVLIALNQLTNHALPLADLERIAAQVGSDVPFFIHQSAAWVRGRGECVEPCVLPGAFDLVLIKPPFPVSTAWAYSAWAKQSPHGNAANISFGGVDWTNDLESPVFEKFILLPVLCDWLQDQPGVHVARMSGSGSTVFAVCDSPSGATSLARSARDHWGKTFEIHAVQTLSPRAN